MIIPGDLVAEAAAVSLVLFVFLVLAVPLVLAMVGTVEGQEARPLEAAVTWMRRHRARHRRSSRRLRAQWDVQLAHAGGRYEDLPSVAEYDTDTLRLFHGLNHDTEDASGGQDSASPPGVLEELSDEELDQALDAANNELRSYIKANVNPLGILDKLGDTDFFAAVQWDIRRSVNELAVLQRDLWAKYRLPAWSPYKWRHRP